jgi:hypothetical protein
LLPVGISHLDPIGGPNGRCGCISSLDDDLCVRRGFDPKYTGADVEHGVVLADEGIIARELCVSALAESEWRDGNEQGATKIGSADALEQHAIRGF